METQTQLSRHNKFISAVEREIYCEVDTIAFQFY